MYRLSRIDAPPETLAGEKLAGRLLRYSLITSGIVCVFVILLTPSLIDSSKGFWIIGLSLLLPLKALHGVYDAWYRARQLIPESIFYYQMLPEIAKVSFLFLVWNIWPNIYAVVLALILSELVPLTIRYIKKPLNFFENNVESKLTNWDFKYAGKLALTTGISKTVKYADILMMGILSTSVKTAEYVIASKFALLLMIGHQINNNIITPRIGKFLSKKDFKSIYLEYHQSRVLTLSFSFLGAIFYTLFGYYLLSLFGEYQQAYSTLLILCATYVLTISFGMSGGYLNIAGYPNLTLLATGIVLITNVFVNYLLIPILGGDGAAIAMLVSFTIANIITSIMILYKDNLKTYSIELAAFTVVFVTILLCNASHVLSATKSSILLTFIFLLFLISEREFLMSFIHNLKKYIKIR
jgi:O-antigen/teichoic acid export membrane protein